MSQNTADGASRRAFLQAGAASIGALALAQTSKAQDWAGGRIQPGPIGTERGMGTYGLVNRITYGVTREEADRFDNIGYAAYLEEQLSPLEIDDSECASRLRQFQSLDMTPYNCLRGLDESIDPSWECVQSQIVRAIYSKRQLQEIMVEFWLDHFNVYIHNSASELMPTHIATIRKYCLGSFHTLLTNVVKQVQVMWYLDNLNNVNGFTNQNFGRELLELHTLGVDGGYTQRDVETATAVFTGWGMDGYYEWPWDQTTNRNWGKFKFYADKHDTSQRYFMGDLPEHLIPAGGQAQGDLLLQRLATHPSTAWNIARKLCRKFLSYEPSYNTIEAAANAFLSSNGNIRTVLNYILRDIRLSKWYKPKFKRPYHFTISSLRAMRAEMTDSESIIWELLNNMRQVPLHWAPPNGYPDAMNVWVENLRPRWYMAFQMPMNWLWNARVDVYGLFKDRTRDGVIRAIERNLFGGPMSAVRREQFRGVLNSTATNTQIREAFGLALASPEFQMY